MSDIILSIKHNYQVDNESFEKLRSTAQCGYTSACVMLSSKIKDAENDWFVKEFIMHMDKDYLTGKSGVRKGASQGNYKSEIDYYLQKYEFPQQAKVIPQGGTIDNIKVALSVGSPLMLSTMLTTSGHYICIVGIKLDSRVLICHDPYGRYDFANKRYIVNPTAGAYVEYKFDDIFPVMEASSKVVFGQNAKGFRMIWLG